MDNNLQPCQNNRSHINAPHHAGRLTITCAQAKHARNYGLTRMDPYVRIRLGHYVYETQTDPNGGKQPKCNRVIQSQLPIGVNAIYVEIYDECSFKMDELIAWCEIKIPQKVFTRETHEELYPLSGKQGYGIEGAVYIVLSFSNPPFMYQTIQSPTHMVVVSSGRSLHTPQQSIHQSSEYPVEISEADIKQMREMFPIIDAEFVKTLYEVNKGNKDSTINSLLQMNEY